MQPHEPAGPADDIPLNERPSHSEFPDEAARAEGEVVPTSFTPQTEQRTRRAAKSVVAVLAAGLVLVSLVRIWHAHTVAKAGDAAFGAAPPVDVVVARPTSVGQDLVLPGQTAAWYESTLYARVNGYVASWQVDIGDRVKKGELLASIETPELDAELSAARAQLSAAQAQVRARKAEAVFAGTANERWADAPKGVVSEQERESKKADYASAQARLNAADAQVTLDKSKVDQYTALAEFKQVRAPFDGTITERKIDIGNLVTAGSSSTTTSLYRMAQTDPLRVFVEVPQSAAGDLMNAGTPAQIRATGAVGGVFAGKIVRSAGSLNAQSRTMRVEVDMPNAAHALVPGMYVSVAFQLPPRGSVEVPAAALIFRSSGTQVALVNGEGRIVFQDVTIARDNGRMVELAAGVKPGDRLVLNLSSQIAAGESVQARAVDAPPPAPTAQR